MPTPQPPVPTTPREPTPIEPTLEAVLPGLVHRPGRWKVALRLLVSVGVLAILVIKTPDLDGVVPDRNHVHTATLLALALLLTIAGIVLSLAFKFAPRFSQTYCIFMQTRVYP